MGGGQLQLCRVGYQGCCTNTVPVPVLLASGLCCEPSGQPAGVRSQVLAKELGAPAVPPASCLVLEALISNTYQESVQSAIAFG